jgi:hypothetical protein
MPVIGYKENKDDDDVDEIDGFLLTVVTCVVWVFTGMLKKYTVNGEVLQDHL